MAAVAIEQARPATQPDVSLDLDSNALEPGYPSLPESPAERAGFPEDLGIPLEFGSVTAPPELPRISLDDIASPEASGSAGGGERTAGDPHLIDFDMFDVTLPPLPERPANR